MKKICDHCGKQFRTYPSEIKSGRRFCSFECRNSAWAKGDHRIHKGASERKCPQCGLVTRQYYPWNHAVCIDCKGKNIHEGKWFCLFCKIRKPIGGFYDPKHHSRCKKCENSQARTIEHRAHENKWSREKRKNDPEWREKKNRRRREKWANDNEFRDRQKAKSHEKYWSDPERMRKAKKEEYKRNRSRRAEQQGLERKRRKDNGFCVYCGNNPSKQGFVHCESCLEYRREAVRKRRVLGSDGYIGTVTEKAIMDRYGAVCQLCGKPIDLLLRFPDPMSLTFDHIIPVTKGGGETESNLQPAHLRCNQKKSVNIVLSSNTLRAMNAIKNDDTLLLIYKELVEIRKELKKNQRIEGQTYPLFEADKKWLN